MWREEIFWGAGVVDGPILENRGQFCSASFPGGWFRVPTKDFHQTHGDCVYALKGWTTRDVKYLEARPGRSAPSGGALLSAEAFQCTLGKPAAALDEP